MENDRRTVPRPAGDLWIRDLRSGAETRVIKEPSVVEARISPDGKFLSFLNAGGGLHIVSLGSMQPIGGEPIKGVACDLIWSPSGTSLLVAKHEEAGLGTDIWLIGVPDGRELRLTNEPGVDDRPAWSPDGEQILFVSGRSGLASLWMMSPDGGGQVQITNKGIKGGTGRAPEGFVPVPLSSRDLRWKESRRVTYSGGDGLWNVDIETGEAEKIQGIAVP